MKINIITLIILILIDIFGINTLWNEKTDRRILHHLMNCNYNPNKIPYLQQFKKLLDIKQEHNNTIISNIPFDFTFLQGNGINTYSQSISSLTGGMYSKRSSLYYNDFPILNYKDNLKEIGNDIKAFIERNTQKQLFWGNSDFQIVLLRYEGSLASFAWHYDTENTSCYRTLTLIRKNGTLPLFHYIDIKRQVKSIHFDIGDTIFFKGSQTYHMVENSNDTHSMRWMLGYQFCEIEDNIHKSICSEFRGATTYTIMTTFLQTILPSLLLIKIFSFKIINSDLLLYIFINLFILWYNISNNHIDIKTYIIYYIYTLIYLDPTTSFGYISYILITE